MNRLTDQVVLISGGASGLGRAIVERFIKEGARLHVLDRNQKALDQLRSEHKDSIHITRGDVRVYKDNHQAVADCVDHFGKIDCIIGNAGIWDYSIPLTDISEERLSKSFDEVFQINVLGYLLLAKASLKHLVSSKGSMIFTVSNAGFLPNGGGTLYTASKHAVVGLVRQLAFELAPHVRVNGVAPGGIATALRGPESLDMNERVFPGERMADNASQYVPLGRMATAEEYAGAYVFFASREDHMPATGSILNNDGGFGIRGLGPTPRGGDDLLDQL